MPGYVGVSGTYKEILPGSSVGVSGTWKAIEGAWVGVGGVWKQWFIRITVTLASGTAYASSAVNASNGACSAGIRVTRDGDVEKGSNNSSTTPSYTAVGGSPNEWAEPAAATAGDSFHVRFVTTSGSPSVGTAGSWLALTSDRSLEVNANLGTTSTWEGKIEISDDGGSTVLAESGVFTISAISFSL